MSQRLDNVHVVIGDANVQFRATVKRALADLGAKNVTDAGTLDEVIKQLDDISVDLLLGEAELPGGDLCEMVQKVRNHALGRNPFVAVIATTSTAEAMGIQRILGSGVDDLLVKPVGIDIVLDRITKLIDARKPFVVTHNYIGPDRRGIAGIRAGEKDPLVPIEVPNTLRDKVLGMGNEERLQTMIDQAVSMLNGKKMERYSVEIAYLVKRVQQGLKSRKSVYEMRGDLERLGFVGKDLQRRMVGTSAEHAAYLAGSLVTVAERAGKTVEGPTQRDVELLIHLAAAIRHAFASDPSAVEAAMEITDTIAKFAEKH